MVYIYSKYIQHIII